MNHTNIELVNKNEVNIKVKQIIDPNDKWKLNHAQSTFKIVNQWQSEWLVVKNDLFIIKTYWDETRIVLTMVEGYDSDEVENYPEPPLLA